METNRAQRAAVAVLAVSALTIGGVGLADAESSASQPHQRSAGPGARPAPTPVTGAALPSASSAAIAAVPGATVERARVANSPEASGAVYDVELTKSDGTHADVIEDASFKVLAVRAGGRFGGGPGGGNPNEPALTGAPLTSASAAALGAVPGGRVTRASTEDKNDKSGAAYEVHVTKADGTQATVLEDSAFKVLSVTAGGLGGPGAPGGPHPPGPGH